MSCLRHALPCLGLTALLLAAGSHGLQNAVAEGETRSLTMHHTHTGEDITITYKRDGRYDDEALQKVNWFLRDWRREQQTRMDPHLLDVIWEVYRDTGAKEQIQVVCGYRSPETNSMLRHRSRNSGVAQFSQHMLGRAMDFYIPGVRLEELRYAGLRLQRGGVGFYPTSGSPFVHLDTGNVRHWPRMTHEQLARVFPNGKTVHVPTDGRPLAGYSQALAEVGRRGSTPSSASVAEARATGAISNDDAVRAGVQTGSRGLLAKLFGIHEPVEDSEAEIAADSKGTSHARVTEISVAPVKPKLASVIPVPSIRQKRTEEEILATIPPSPAESPVNQINDRGNWNTRAAAPLPAPAPAAENPSGTDTRAAPGAIGAGGHHFVWFSGPQPKSAAPAGDNGAPRPPQAIPTTDSASENTGAIGPWSKPFNNDRVRGEVALAYAAPEPLPQLIRRGVPVGARVESPAPVRDARQKQVMAHHQAIAAGTRAYDPWLRGLILAPSVRDTMIVSWLGPTDYRTTLQPLMHKPTATIVMTFSQDPQAGLSAGAFAGAAITFLPTASFAAARTARLD